VIVYHLTAGEDSPWQNSRNRRGHAHSFIETSSQILTGIQVSARLDILNVATWERFLDLLSNLLEDTGVGIEIIKAVGRTVADVSVPATVKFSESVCTLSGNKDESVARPRESNALNTYSV
jgi:hypothetical protein